MTLLDVLRLVRHYLKLCVVVVAICTLFGGVVGLSRTLMGHAEYSARAVLTVSEPTATVSANELMPLVEATANNVIVSIAREGISVTQEYDLSSRSITFTAVAASEKASINAANDAASQTAEQMKLLLSEMAQQYRARQTTGEDRSSLSDEYTTVQMLDRDRATALEAVSFTINDASQAAANSGKSTLVKFVIVGLLGGVVLAICIVVSMGLVKEPIKTRGDIERISALPLLADGLDNDFYRRLWANIQFAANTEPRSICLVSVGGVDADTVEKRLRDVILHEGMQLQLTDESDGRGHEYEPTILSGQALATDVSIAFGARRAEVTVVLVKCWIDSSRQLEATLRELEIAGARVAGFALFSKRR